MPLIIFGHSLVKIVYAPYHVGFKPLLGVLRQCEINLPGFTFQMAQYQFSIWRPQVVITSINSKTYILVS